MTHFLFLCLQQWRTVVVMARLLAAALACLALACAAGATPAATPPPLVGVVQVGSLFALRPLDPRTLAPLPGSWSQPVARNAELVRSPLGTGVLTENRGRAIVVDTRTGRVVHRFAEGIAESWVYWLGGELPVGRRDGPRLVAEMSSVCWSTGCGNAYSVIGSGAREHVAADTVAVLRRRLVIATGGGDLGTLEPPQTLSGAFRVADIRVPGLPRSSPVRVVADVANDRLYAISSAGTVARVDNASGRPSVSYHRVELNGRAFSAEWAGGSRIALWGPDGLGTIDTRSWTTKAVAQAAVGVVATPYGLVTWTGGRSGVTIYRADGTRRFTTMPAAIVRSAEAVGRYLYVVAGRRYAVDLVTGRVVGRVRRDARIAQPSFLALP